MKTIYNTKYIPMKTLTRLLVVLLCCWAGLANAQCGVQAYFTDTVNPNNVPVFQNQSTVSPGYTVSSYVWNFGDGTSSNQQNPSHVFTQPGNYNVCLLVTVYENNTPGQLCTDTFCSVYNNCNGMVQADISYQTSSGYVVYTGTATSNYPPIAYSWSFPGGMPGTSVTSVTTVQYPNAGFYDVCLTATDANGCSVTTCDTVTVSGGNLCNGVQANFTSTLNGNLLSVDAGTNNYPAGTQFQWRLDGGQPTGVFSQFSQYQWQGLDTGTHTVCLFVYTANDDLCDSICKTITVQPAGACNVNMNAVFTANTANGSTVFGANGNPSGTVYTWHFGDGTTTTTTSPQTSHQYPLDSNTQIYTGCLIVSIPGTICADTSCVDVVVPGVGSNGCQADFTWSFPNNSFTPHFNDNSTGNPTGWMWTFGDGGGSTAQNPQRMYTAPGIYYVCLTVVTSTCTSQICKDVVIVPAGSNNDTVCGVVFNDDNSNGVMDGNENPMSGISVYAGNYLGVTDSNGYYQILVQGGFAGAVSVLSPQGCIPTLPQNNENTGTNGVFYYVTPNNNLHGCGYNFAFNCNLTSICGMAYFDANNNGTQDNNETGLSGVHIIATGSNSQAYNAYTDNTGSYCVTVPTGTYIVNASGSNYNTCALTPTQISVAATTIGQQYGSNNFAIYCQPGVCNLQITLTPHTTVTPGFQAWYDVQVKNIGASVATGTANLFYDAALSFLNANPPQSSHNASTQTLSFNLPNLMPGQSAYYYVKFNAPQSLALNTPIFNLANVIAGCNDVNLTNNVDTIHQTVTGSWDPNNKLAYVTNYETNPAYQIVSSIDANQRIEYVINFQNEGNGPAVNVVVKDVISSDLDVSTFELLGTSHNCQVTLNGNDANFKFSNIMLPAKVTDEPNSHGFIKFAINAINNLPAGHVIADDAAIYFDYNSPVITNEAEVTLLEPSGINDVPGVTATIAPNPMSQYTTIRLNNNSEGFKLRVTDVTGRTVSEQISSTNNLRFERNALAAGLYTYQIIQHNKAVANGKLVIQ